MLCTFSLFCVKTNKGKPIRHFTFFATFPPCFNDEALWWRDILLFFLCLALNLSNPSSLHFLFKHAPQSEILTFSRINHPVLISTGSPGLWWNALILLCVSLPCCALFYLSEWGVFFGFFSEWFLMSLREFPSSSMSSCVLRSCWTAIILWIGENNGAYPLYAVSLKWGTETWIQICCEIVNIFF